MGGKVKITEYGSDFNLCTSASYLLNDSKFFFDNKKSSYFLSGRAALYALIEFGINKHNWKDAYIPSYYCHEVNSYLKSLQINIHSYQYDPYFFDKIDYSFFLDKSSSVIVKNNYFGFETPNFNKIKKAFVVEDSTHNLEGVLNSKANYVFGSLRKELPVPVGGFVFSDKNTIPVGKENLKADEIARKKLTAMSLKTLYLEAGSVDKSSFRKLFSDAESLLELDLKGAKLPKISELVFKKLNVQKILNQKKENLKTALKNLKLPKEVIINKSEKSKGFGLMFLFNTHNQRDKLKSYLIQKHIYPAVLWPDQNTEIDKNIESRILFIHIDFRYSKKDIIYITDIINLFFNGQRI